MARRGGRPGSYLMTDDYYGVTRFNSQLRKDYWGNYAQKPLLRNLQEIASPLNDPLPVNPYSGPTYEVMPDYCLGEIAPFYVGNTTVPTNQNNAAFQALNLAPGIGSMEIGCSFQVY